MSTSLTKQETTANIQVWKNNWKEALGAIKVDRDMTFTDLRKLNTPSVSMMNVGEKNTDNGVRIFQALVLNIVKFLGAEWTNEQVLECGKICFDEANYLTFAELSHFAQKAKSGGFDKVYGKFTPATFMDWFTIYTGENLEQRMCYFGKSNNESKWTPPENPVPDEKVSELFNDFTNKLTAELQAEKEHDFKDRDERLKKYNEMLLNQARLAGKAKTYTDEQIPDQCENDIPN